MSNPYLVVWRASGEAFDVDAFLGAFSLPVSTTWHKGDTGRRDRILDNSGFLVDLGNVATPEAAKHRMFAALLAHRPAFEELQRRAVSSVIDVGLVTGGSERFTCSIRLEAKELAVLAALGVAFQASGYPGGGD